MSTQTPSYVSMTYDCPTCGESMRLVSFNPLNQTAIYKCPDCGKRFSHQI